MNRYLIEVSVYEVDWWTTSTWNHQIKDKVSLATILQFIIKHLMAFAGLRYRIRDTVTNVKYYPKIKVKV